MSDAERLAEGEIKGYNKIIYNLNQQLTDNFIHVLSM